MTPREARLRALERQMEDATNLLVRLTGEYTKELRTKSQYVRVRFLGKGWARSEYTYEDPTGKLQEGDVVIAGMYESEAVVVGIGHSESSRLGMGTAVKVD